MVFVHSYQNILFRADAIGGGATFNEDDIVEAKLEQALKRLKVRRDSTRPRPALDDKVSRGKPA